MVRSLAAYGVLAVGLASQAWLSRQMEAMPAVNLSPWDVASIPLVVLDAGHGGHDGGAVAGGTIEKNLALELTLRLRDELLREGLRVKMTRDTDIFVPLEERAAMANEAGAAAFVSLHLNTSSSGEVSGVETYFTERKSLSVQRALQAKWSLTTGSLKDKRGRWLAECLQQHVCRVTKTADRGIKERNYAVVSQTSVPAALVECGFLTHPTEAAKLKQEAYQKQLTAGLVAGILQYLKAHHHHPQRGIQLLTGPATAPQEEREVATP